MSAFGIFDPNKTSSVDYSESTNHGKDSLCALLDQYGSYKTALALDGEAFWKQGLITDGAHAEWTTFSHYIAKQPKEDMSSELNSLLTKWHAQNNIPQFTYPSQCLHDTSS